MIEGLEKLTSSDQITLLNSIQHLLPLLAEQRLLLQKPKTIPFLEPHISYDTPDSSHLPLGKKLISEQKVACLILAGGQASRLGSFPKALFPIRNKTLLQIFCEKAKGPIAIMTSHFTHAPIQEYLQSNNYFGLNIHLFQQDSIPLLSQQGNWFLDPSNHLALGPDGNGHALKKLLLSNPSWPSIEYLNIVPIDNPLADPFDPFLIGYHAHHKNDITLKSILRNSPTEKVGVIVQKNSTLAVQEYSELPDHFPAPLAHIGLFCLNVSFISRIANLTLPWHLASKKFQDQQVWKFERFLFDILPFTSHKRILVYPREDIYAPLKNLTGANSPATVEKALDDFEKRHGTFVKFL